MAAGLEPAFAPGHPIWPLAGMSPAGFEPDDPDLAIPRGALQPTARDLPERLFRARHGDLITHRPTEPLSPQPARARDLRLKWKLALIASCVFHAAIAFFFIQAADDAAKMEGAEYSGEAMLGNASDEQISAGDTANMDGAVDVTMITMLQAKSVETVEAEAVPVEEGAQAAEAVTPMTAGPEALQPAEETISQSADVAHAEPVEPTLAQPVEPEVDAEPAVATTAETASEVLATERPVEDDNVVQVPAQAKETETAETSEAVAVEQADVAKPSAATTVEAVQPEKSEAKPLGATTSEKTVQAEPEPEPKKAEQKPIQKKAEPEAAPAKKEAAARKQEAKPAAKNKKATTKASSKQANAGNRGQSKADTRRGQANGAAGSQASSKGGKSSAAGNAAVSNYPGKVAAKLRRSLRYPAAAKRQKLRGTVQVSFIVSASGGVGSVRVVASSGSPILDKAALDTVRRAAPFPAIPKGAGRSAWPFSVPLAFSR